MARGTSVIDALLAVPAAHPETKPETTRTLTDADNLFRVYRLKTSAGYFFDLSVCDLIFESHDGDAAREFVKSLKLTNRTNWKRPPPSNSWERHALREPHAELIDASSAYGLREQIESLARARILTKPKTEELAARITLSLSELGGPATIADLDQATGRAYGVARLRTMLHIMREKGIVFRVGREPSLWLASADGKSWSTEHLAALAKSAVTRGAKISVD